MADFNTHVFTAAATASLSATVLTKILLLPVPTALLLTASGTLGGILPDIDLKHSTPSKILFSVLGIITALAWLFARIPEFSALELWVFALGIFLLVRFPLWALFHQFTVHRGSLHSLSAALMFAFLTAGLGNHVLLLPAATSWMLAAFLTGGYLLHLLLDEIYSVDFTGARIKRSFGTAMKILDTQRLVPSCLVLFVAMVAWFWTPPLAPLLTLMAEMQVDWESVLLPDYLSIGQQP